jgi:hypothetical protein
MTQNTETEPTLSDIINRLDKLDTDLREFSTSVSKDVEKLSTDVEKFNDRFTNYQQATQWVVQLAFTLIASATITIIIAGVFKR